MTMIIKMVKENVHEERQPRVESDRGLHRQGPIEHTDISTCAA